MGEGGWVSEVGGCEESGGQGAFAGQTRCPCAAGDKRSGNNVSCPRQLAACHGALRSRSAGHTAWAAETPGTNTPPRPPPPTTTNLPGQSRK